MRHMNILFISVFLGCSQIGTGLTHRYNAIEAQYKKGENTLSDRLFMNLIYRGRVLADFLIVPYASSILRPCVKGKSSTLKILSRYIRKRSPTVQQKNRDS